MSTSPFVLLPSSHARAHDTFPEADALEQQLRANIRGPIAGLIGNTSCGVHPLMGGKTVDNIPPLDLLLYDGTRLTVGPTTEAELTTHIQTGGRTGEIYSALKSIRDTYADQVRAK